MDVIRLVEAKFLSVAEKILEVLADGVDFVSFEDQLKKELDNLGCDLLKVVIEELEEQIFRSQERKRDWKSVHKEDDKEILTVFGTVRYQRRYYKHKQTNEYRYLVDEKIGVTPHTRVSANLKAELSEASSELSYEGATLQVSRHNAELKVSKQTVANCVKTFKAGEAPPPKEKRRVSVLYVEADEDHVNIRGAKDKEARLIYVHEGVVDYPRRSLKNVRYFTTVNKKPEAFWLEVCDYIDTHYDFLSIKKIFLSGDGSPWIRVGLQYIPGAVYVLDRFHLAKYITQATAHAPDLRNHIYKGIRSLNKPTVLAWLQEALERADEPSRQKRIRDTIKYIDNNWDGIEAQTKNPHVTCSAEGHVSHILAARLSSRPMAWSVIGAEQMSAMRSTRANGESIKEHYLAMQKPAPVIIELKQAVQNELKRVRQKKLTGREYLNNVPLFKGGSNFTRSVLKILNEPNVV